MEEKSCWSGFKSRHAMGSCLGKQRCMFSAERNCSHGDWCSGKAAYRISSASHTYTWPVTTFRRPGRSQVGELLWLACQIESLSLQSIRLSTTNNRTKKGLQGGKTIQQRSDLASLWSLMLPPVLWLMPLRSLFTHVCESTGATHL
jgi:hypothetical protein